MYIAKLPNRDEINSMMNIDTLKDLSERLGIDILILSHVEEVKHKINPTENKINFFVDANEMLIIDVPRQISEYPLKAIIKHLMDLAIAVEKRIAQLESGIAVEDEYALRRVLELDENE